MLGALLMAALCCMCCVRVVHRVVPYAYTSHTYSVRLCESSATASTLLVTCTLLVYLTLAAATVMAAAMTAPRVHSGKRGSRTDTSGARCHHLSMAAGAAHTQRKHMQHCAGRNHRPRRRWWRHCLDGAGECLRCVSGEEPCQFSARKNQR